MKKLEFIIRPEKLEDIKEVLNEMEVFGMTVTMVSGCGTQKGRREVYRGVAYNINLLPKIKVEVILPDNMLSPAVEAIVKAARTGKIGDGKVFVSAIENAIRIRTGETAESAV